jgi:Zn-dependent metalloprotease
MQTVLRIFIYSLFLPITLLNSGNLESINSIRELSYKINPQKPFIYHADDDGITRNLSGVLKINDGQPFESLALDFLINNNDQFGFESFDQDFEIKSIQSDYKGITHITLQQIFNGIPVLNSFTKLHSDHLGNLSSITSDYVPNLNLNTSPSISANDAIIGVEELYNIPDYTDIIPELFIFTQIVTPNLAWVFDVSDFQNSKRYIVDANSGELLKTYPLAYEDGPATGSGINLLDEPVENLNIYEGSTFDWSSLYSFIPPESEPGTGNFNMVDVTNESAGSIFILSVHNTNYESFDFINSESPEFLSEIPYDSHPSGVSALDYHRKTLDYYISAHDHYGLDGNGYRTAVVVDLGPNIQNAYATQYFLVYGRGGGQNRPWCASQDVVSHEFTHIVTGSSSGLIYQNHSGAMNESLSDIFGYLVEAEFQNGGDWFVGEDVTLNGNGIRSMEDPTAFNHPDNINSPYYMPPVNNPNGNNDNGGVHSNSGIPNKAFQMMVEGGLHYGIEVEPFDMDLDISREIAADIWYIWNTQYLTPNDNFLSGAFKMLDVCNDVFSQHPYYFDTAYAGWLSVGIDIYAVDLALTDELILISDGDDDSIINPGESFDLHPMITNIGVNPATDVSASISCLNAGVNILEDEMEYGYLGVDESAYPTGSGFQFELSDDILMGDPGCTLFVSAVNVSGQTDSFEFPLSLFVSLYQENWPMIGDFPVQSSPAVVHYQQEEPYSEIFFGDNNGSFYGLADDGSILDNWPYETGDDIWGSTAIADIDLDGELEIVIGSKNKHLYIFNTSGDMLLNLNINKYLMATPAIGNLDDDDDLEIVIGTYGSQTSSNQIIAINPDGSAVDGFPVTIGEKIQRGAALADFNGNGKMDIVVGTDSENIYLVYDDGSIATGFPYTDADGDFRQAPSIIKMNDDELIILAGSKDDNFYGINSDGTTRFIIETDGNISTSCGFIDDPEHGLIILFGSDDGYLYAVSPDGAAITGWPINLGSPVSSTPSVADLNNDGIPEIITGTSAGEIHIFDLYGNIYPNFPFNYQRPIYGAPAIVDTDGDGDLEVLIGALDGVISLDIKDTGSIDDDWNLFRGGLTRTGYFESSPMDIQPGDVNDDQIVDVLDVVIIVNFVMGISIPDQHQFEASDLNDDDIIDILDIVILVSIIMGS